MFCPQAIEWGTVATWVSGLATSTAATIALWVALSNRAKDRTEKASAIRRDAEIENAMLVECLSFYRTIKRVSEDVQEQFSRGEISFTTWNFVLEDARERALRFQQMPAVNIKMFHELEAIVRIGRHPEEARLMDMPDVENLVASIIYTCSLSSERIIKSPNKNAPFNW